MSRPVSALPNLGPRSVEWFAKAGIESAEALVALGADAAYARLLASGVQPHFMGYCAVALGVQGRPWSDFHPAEKAALRARFDAIKAAATRSEQGRSEFEAALDRLGVVKLQPTSSRPEKK